MSRILAYTSPAKGHLFPASAILFEVLERGHDVHLRTLASEVEVLRAQGLSAEPLAPAVEAIAMNDWQERSPQKALAASVSTFATRAPFDAADLAAAIEEESPDLLIVDINAWGAMAVAETSGLPWAAFCPYPMPLPSTDAPPFGPGLPPASGPLGRARDRLLRPVVTGTLERKMLPSLNEVRVGLGLAPLARFADQFTRPRLLLYLTAEPFEYPRRDWPPNVVMVGPCEWEPPAEAGAVELVPGVPLVVVTTSSEFQNDARLVQAVFDGLADEQVQVVATLPSADASGLRIPRNGSVESFVPHSALFDQAAVVVTHGGMGATQKALARGVPVCAVPFGRDQAEVARRVEVSEAGVRLPARRLSPQRVREAVLRAMDKGTGARAVADAFGRAGGARAAADAVTGMLVPS